MQRRQVYTIWISILLILFIYKNEWSVRGAGFTQAFAQSPEPTLTEIPRPTVPPTSPSTPTPTSIPKPTRPSVAATRKPTVGHIVLLVEPKQSDLWSVVQWQNAQEEWEDIEGWRGTVVNGKTEWWVEEKDFSKRARWVVYGADGVSLAASEPFTLPNQSNLQLIVPISLESEELLSDTVR